MNKLLLFFATFACMNSFNANASFPEFFGASYSTSAIGNQANLESNDPSNNYYAPSVLAFSKRVNALLQATITQTQFKPISNIIVTNTSTSAAVTSGNVSNKYPKFLGSSIHLALPIGYEDHGNLGTLGISLFMPVGKLIQTNSGNSFLPEYVLYHSRYQRTSAYLNFAHAFGDEFAVSLGGIIGFQASADVTADITMNGGNYGSSSNARSEVSPSLGLIFSTTKKINDGKIYFTYQQEMKSNLHAHAAGEVTVSAGTGLPFDSSIDSMIFYDPHTFRLGTEYSFSNFNIFASAEYQLWSNYKTPIITITKVAGVMEPSRNYEVISTRNTLSPRIGLKSNLTDRWSSLLGFNYRQSPLKGNFSGSGNSLDTNAFIYTAGIQYRMVIWSKDVHLGTSFEYHQLERKQVTKTLNEENGNSGSKIGSPGYTIGGKILAGSFGVKFNF